MVRVKKCAYAHTWYNCTRDVCIERVLYWRYVKSMSVCWCPDWRLPSDPSAPLRPRGLVCRRPHPRPTSPIHRSSRTQCGGPLHASTEMYSATPVYTNAHTKNEWESKTHHIFQTRAIDGGYIVLHNLGHTCMDSGCENAAMLGRKVQMHYSIGWFTRHDYQSNHSIWQDGVSR